VLRPIVCAVEAYERFSFERRVKAQPVRNEKSNTRRYRVLDDPNLPSTAISDERKEGSVSLDYERESYSCLP